MPSSITQPDYASAGRRRRSCEKSFRSTRHFGTKQLSPSPPPRTDSRSLAHDKPTLESCNSVPCPSRYASVRSRRPTSPEGARLPTPAAPNAAAPARTPCQPTHSTTNQFLSPARRLAKRHSMTPGQHIPRDTTITTCCVLNISKCPTESLYVCSESWPSSLGSLLHLLFPNFS